MASHPLFVSDPPPSSSTSNPKWQKILYRAQPFPSEDNYFPPEEFLKDLVTNSAIHLPSYTELVLKSVPIGQHFLNVVLFIGTFVYVEQGWLENRASSTFFFLQPLPVVVGLAVILVTILLGSIVGNVNLIKSKSTIIKTKGSRRTRKRDNKGEIRLVSLVILGLVLLAISPVLRTLTESTTTDTIWALSVALFTLHLGLADYSFPFPPVASSPTPTASTSDSGGDGKDNTSATTMMATTTTMETIRVNDISLAETLSLNAAISASVVLASRLQSNLEVFGLLTLAIVLFGFGSLGLKKLRLRSLGNSSSLPKFNLHHVNVSILLIQYLLALCVWTGSNKSSCVFFSCILGFITLLCPAWIKYNQVYKLQINGPWDPAEIKLANATRVYNAT